MTSGKATKRARKQTGVQHPGRLHGGEIGTFRKLDPSMMTRYLPPPERPPEKRSYRIRQRIKGLGGRRSR